LASHRAVQVFSAEHFLRSHHAWTCAGAPIKDPRTGQVVGVVDVSGPAATVHPTTIALVDLVARLAEAQLREVHDRTLNRLRTVAAPILARVGRPALAVDSDGWVAAVDSLPPHGQLLLPDNGVPGRTWIPSLGPCDVESLPGGWLVQLADDVDKAHAGHARPVRWCGPEPGRRRTVRHLEARHSRHAEILHVLATHRQERSRPNGGDLYGDSRVVTVRAEMSRLRRQSSVWCWASHTGSRSPPSFA
jgi:transcriptional regulator of acetoin/glycerol metabolism